MNTKEVNQDLWHGVLETLKALLQLIEPPGIL
jgi:hypothetical protein